MSRDIDIDERELERFIQFLQEQIKINEERKQKLAGRLADL